MGDSTLNTTQKKLKQKSKPEITLCKLVGTSWGSSLQVLRTSALTLVHSTAEYCAPVWDKSAHCKNVDTGLHKTVRIISETLKSTKSNGYQNYQTLYHLTRQKIHSIKTLEKVKNNPHLFIYVDIMNLPTSRLKPRHPV